MPKRVLVLMNPGSGSLAQMDEAEASERIRGSFARLGLQARVELGPARQLIELAQGAEDVDALIAGGGDGTINALANVAAERDIAFGVLPLGTHNHFAKDLGVPLELDEAVAWLARAQVEDLPVGEVNGRVFLSFSAIGLHPDVVEDRDQQRREKKRGKWLAMVIAFARNWMRLPLKRVEIRFQGKRIVRVTPSVIVCNNPHQMQVFGVENASVPDRGLLNVYTAHEVGRMRVIWLMLRALVGRLEETRGFEALALGEFELWTMRRHVRVSLDGEVMRMDRPLRYRIRPRPLRVLRSPA